jgi:transcriptional regulator with XRE-family HTH domain
MTHPRILVDGREYIPRLAPAINKNQTLGQYLAALREDSGMTVEDVTALTGVRDFHVESWEKNAALMPFNHAVLLARAYGVPLDLLALRVLAVEPEAGEPLATHFDFQGTAQRSTPGKPVDPLRTPAVITVKVEGPPEIVVEDEVDEVQEDDAPETPRVYLDSYIDDSDEYVEDEDAGDADEVAVDEEPPAAFDTPPTPADRLRALASDLL